MATNNFYNHENGIFVLPQLDYDDALEGVKESIRYTYYDKEEGLLEALENITDEQVYDEMSLHDEMMFEDFFYSVKDNLPKGLYLSIKSELEAVVLSKQGKYVAILSLEAGYYSGAQVIIETNPEEIFGDYYPETQTELFEQYTPHNKRLISTIKKLTTPIVKIGGFSNGEALYEIA